jgi:predicted ATPase with chaperone activity
MSSHDLSLERETPARPALFHPDPELDPGAGSAVASAQPGRSLAPPAPRTLEETGLTGEAVDDLLLKALYVQGVQTGRELTAALALPHALLDERLLLLQQRRHVAVGGTTGPNRGSYRFDLTDAGRGRAREAMQTSQYVGPAPVPLATFEEWIEKQSLRHVRVTPETIASGFGSLVLDPALFDLMGPAVNSARSIFLHGEPGNGKTTIAEIIATLLGGSIFIPSAVDITGQTMVLYDPSHHQRVSYEENGENGGVVADQASTVPAGAGTAAPGSPAWLRDVPDYDRRFVRIRRPVVVAGGELTLDQLDLQYDHHTRMYQAPFQLKSVGGVLIIDDFGRQRVPPDDLLNRWIVPLEKRFDFLTLHTGVKFRVPFDSLLIFATNLEPKDLVDEAFLRRIQYKIEVTSPDRAALTEIMRHVCESRGLPFIESSIDYLYDNYYNHGVEPRGCHPRDIIEHLQDFARYRGEEARPEGDLLKRACETYFLVMAPEAAALQGNHGQRREE